MEAIYPGSFDPVTYGHLDLIKRASRIFEKVIVAVARNKNKPCLFKVEERIEMLKRATSAIDRVVIDDFDCLTVDYVKKRGLNVIIRGIRMVSDFEYEFQMALTNRKLVSNIETIFMIPSESYSYLSSKLIKEIAALGNDVTPFVPDFVAEKLRRALRKEQNGD